MYFLTELTLYLIGIGALLLVCIERQMRGHPLRVASQNIPGERIWPLFGNIVELIGISNNGTEFATNTYNDVVSNIVNILAAQSFQYIVRKAQKFRQGYRFYAFGWLHYWPIRSHELEVSCVYSESLVYSNDHKHINHNNMDFCFFLYSFCSTARRKMKRVYFTSFCIRFLAKDCCAVQVSLCG